MNKMTLLNEILLELGMDAKDNLNGLSRYELKDVLVTLIYNKEYNEENILLTKKVLDKIYSEEEANFYYEIIEYIYG